MTDDLVGRLRVWLDELEATGCLELFDGHIPTLSEAAARIEALEAEKAELLGRINTMADDLVLMGMARDRYAEVLRTFLTEYVELVESGDAGFWDPETEPKVIAAREGGVINELETLDSQSPRCTIQPSKGDTGHATSYR